MLWLTVRKIKKNIAMIFKSLNDHQISSEESLPNRNDANVHKRGVLTLNSYDAKRGGCVNFGFVKKITKTIWRPKRNDYIHLDTVKPLSNYVMCVRLSEGVSRTYIKLI